MGVVLAFALFGILYIKFDLWWNYRKIPVTVTGFEKFCNVSSSVSPMKERVEHSQFAGAQNASCSGLGALGLEETSFHMTGRNIDLVVHPVWHASIAYISPLDRQLHQTTVWLGAREAKDIRVGSVVTLTISRKAPEHFISA